MSRPHSAKRPFSAKRRQGDDAVSYEDLLIAQYLEELRKASQNGSRAYVFDSERDEQNVCGNIKVALPTEIEQAVIKKLRFVL